MHEMHMCPAQVVLRAILMTFGVMGPGSESQIDDILPPASMQLDLAPVKEVKAIGERSDYLPLQVTISIAPLVLPQDTEAPNDSHTPQNAPMLKRPLNTGQRQMLRVHLANVMCREVHSLAEKILDAYDASRSIHMESLGHQEPLAPVPSLTRTLRPS